MALPEGIKEDGLALAEGSLIYGESFDSLSKDELIAVAALGWKAYEESLKEGARRLDFLSSLKRR